MGRDIIRITLDWRAQGKDLALATITAVNGKNTAIGVAGKQLVVDSEGKFAGACPDSAIAGAIIMHARRTIETGKPELVELRVSKDAAFMADANHAERVKVYVEPFAAA